MMRTMMRKKFGVAKLLLAVVLTCGPLAQLVRADGNAGSVRAGRLRPVLSTANAPIGTIESWGAVTINGQQVGRRSLLWNGDVVQAPAGLGALVALAEVGQVSVRPGAVVRLSTSATSAAGTGRTGAANGSKISGPTLLASLVSGEFAAKLKPNADARIEVNGQSFVVSRGASFRATQRPDGVSVEAETGAVLPVGRWSVAVPQNVVRDAIALQAAGQGAPRRYLIRPYNLGATTDVRARSTRSLQVRVTDENDRPVPDAPVLFLLGGGGGGAAGNVGAVTLRATTNANGIATVQYTPTETVGSRIPLRVQVEGTDSVWQGTLNVIAAKAGFWAPQNAIPIFTVVGVGLGVGIYKIATKEEPARIPPITQIPGGTVIVP